MNKVWSCLFHTRYNHGAACGLAGGALQAEGHGKFCRLPSPADLQELAGEVPADQQGHGAARSDSPIHER